VPDIPGEAGRSAPQRPSWNNDEYVEWLEDVRAAFRVERAALLGLSLGGWIAARFAAARPDRTRCLVLLAPGGIAPMRTTALLKTILYSMQRQKGAARMKRMVFGRGDIHSEVSHFFDLLQQNYLPRLGSPPLLSDQQMKRIACPVLIAGAEDAFFKAEKAAARLKSLLPDSEIHIDISGEHGITEYEGRIASFLAGT
jgi:pimeloyl-ACP methyl ester carboxylesterase